ncbi:squalene/phytoene synthase family protein [Steroidobacter sp. S1-65]|uniref:Squalene/phytoene synthase family protein n=1 Tax=Steroidobacter gossypii TaxID=2805490 RepID=A0ABS1WWF4_9GAMM|nr:squalene/phytoene synthase family protein [Steroidobacter gossypii]MBM0105309.1 squalene/phytoene synthase family protein [Steroidobacter gossypii]
MSAIDNELVNRTAPPGSMRYFSLLYSPEERREVVLALYVIDAEIRESAKSASHDVAHTRLTWWRAETDRLINGNPQHPATRLLHERASGDRAVFAKLHEMLAAADMDLARMTFTNQQELRAYCSRSGGAIQELIASQLVAPGALDEAVRAAANKLGVGIRMTEVVRDLRQDAYDGNVYLPLDLLDKHELKTEHLRAREVDSKLKDALRVVRETAIAELALPSRGSQTEHLRPVFVLAALHRKLLDRIAARNYDVATERIELGPLQKPWTAWLAARKA